MTGPTNLQFGLFLSQARRDWGQVLDEFLEAEELGFDHAWLVDHLVDTDGGPDDGCLEAWTLLAAIAAKTKRIRLGVLVSSNTFRHPQSCSRKRSPLTTSAAGDWSSGSGQAGTRTSTAATASTCRRPRNGSTGSRRPSRSSAC